MLNRSFIIDFLNKYDEYCKDFNFDYFNKNSQKIFINGYSSNEEFINLNYKEMDDLEFDLINIFALNLHLNFHDKERFEEDLKEFEVMNKCIESAWIIYNTRSKYKLGSFKSYCDFNCYCSKLMKKKI